MEFRTRGIIVGLVTLACAWVLAAGATAAPRHHHKAACHQREPMACLAAQHGWNRTQVHYEWLVLARESSSTPGHLNLTAVNGSCYGSGQLIGGPDAYYRFGGNPYTVAGQEKADLNYVAGRYHTPVAAWEHEVTYGWY